ncbi:nSTAND1 domain-containing NTPase [Limnoraphis robusta]|uniref:nSTAND1 domain-containing NTPase n=1 Tax=Limnoraphis robusta TaxID=1118279 RepID=UPI002B206A10|nr:WD40 repeat domain-containing protein [Limnoraphis robusta]MEA5499119.1 WD40 repeat domain-containing protein [Limnoraphis robusta BA-68 BA1]
MTEEEAKKNLPYSQSQTAGNVEFSGNENAMNLLNSANDVSINQSRTIIYNYYYEKRTVTTSTEDDIDDNLICPYQGLYHFSYENSEYFFGREVFVEELFEYTETRNFIPVLGASGSGKSSVILAGLVPKLVQAGRWQFTHFRPGNDPFNALAQALVPLYEPNLNKTELIAQARQLAGYFKNNTVLLSDVFATIQQNNPQNRTLLIADQFEELYTLCPDEKIRRQFLDTLLNTFKTFAEQSSLSTVLVATMRADFLGNALSYRPLVDVLKNANIMLGPMNENELRDVIEKPAQKLGVSFEHGLVERILDDVEQQPGNLPLLEFALTELWKKRQGKQLTHKAYEEIGEVSGALTGYADEKFSKLKPEEKERVRRIFLQLVQPGAGREDTRRVATQADFNESNWDLVKQLADARLVVTSRTEKNSEQETETVEVVHEALIRNWGQLRKWMEVDREFRTWQEQLRSAKKQWEENHRDQGSLLRGSALLKAEEKLQERPEDLEAEKLFIQESIQDRDRLQLQEEERKEQLAKAQKEALEASQAREAQQKQANKKLRIGAIFLSVVTVAAIAAAVGAWYQTKQAQNQTIQAQLNLANSLGQTSKAQLTEGKDLEAFLEAIRAGKILQKYRAKDPQVLGALIGNVYEGRERNRLLGHQNWVQSVSISKDGKTIVSGSYDNTIKVWNRETGALIRTLTGHDSWVLSVSISNDSKTIVSGSADNTIKVWNLETPDAEPLTLTGHNRQVNSVSISNDSKTVVSGSADNTIKVWNLETGALIRTLTGHNGPVNSVSISNDSKTIVSGSDDNTIKVWNLQTGALIRTLTGHDSWVRSVSISNDSKTIVSGNADSTIKVWNLETGKEISTLKGHKGQVWSVSISNDSKTIVSGSEDSTIKVWNLETPDAEPLTLKGHDNHVWSVSISNDGTIVSCSGDNTIKVWNLQTGEEIRTLTGHGGKVNSVSISNDSKTIVSGSEDSTIKVWNLETREEIRTLTGHGGPVRSVSISNDSKTIVSGSDDNTIKVWNLETPDAEPLTLKGHNGQVNSVSISNDSKTIVSGSGDNTIKVWNLETPDAEPLTLKGHNGSVNSVSISNDSKTIVSGSDDNTIKVWNLETPDAEPLTLPGHNGQVWSVSISNDSKTIVSGGADYNIKVWNLETGELIRTLTGHRYWVRSVSISNDSKTIVSGSNDNDYNNIKVWNLETGELIRTLKGHQHWVNSVSISNDGTIVSGSDDYTIKVWDIDFDSLMERNCDWVKNYLQHNAPEKDKGLCEGVGSF